MKYSIVCEDPETNRHLELGYETLRQKEAATYLRVTMTPLGFAEQELIRRIAKAKKSMTNLSRIRLKAIGFSIAVLFPV